MKKTRKYLITFFIYILLSQCVVGFIVSIAYTYIPKSLPDPDTLAGQVAFQVQALSVYEPLADTNPMTVNHITYQFKRKDVNSGDTIILSQIRSTIDKQYPYLNFSVKVNGNSALIVKSNESYPTMVMVGLISTLILVELFIIFVIKQFLSRTIFPIRVVRESLRDLSLEDSISLPKFLGEEYQDIIYKVRNLQHQSLQQNKDNIQMLAAISHDLRTPITRIRLRTEFLEQDENVEKIIEDIEHMEKMISAVLAYSKDSTHVENFVKFDLVSLLESIVDNYEDIGCKVEFSTDIDTAITYGRRHSIVRAIENLINNSLKYSEDVFVSILDGDNNYIIEVQDYGGGIPPEYLSEVLKPFFKVDKARSNTKKCGSWTCYY